MFEKRGLARLFAICALAASVVLILAACGASTSGGYSGTPTPKGGAASGGSGGGSSISVSEKEFSITPSDVTAAPGPITFHITNTGSVAHDITVNVNGAIHASPLVQPGKTETWSVTINTPGKYDMYCSVPGHKEAGMNGSLTVGGAASGGSSSSSAASSGSSSSGSGGTVKVSEKEWSITVNGTAMSKGQGDVNVPAGTVTFDIKNDGSVTHEFEIQGNGVDKKTGAIDPGKSTTLTVDLTAGKYEVFCPIPGHKEAGMDGFVTAS